jgi:hypothetical protein
LVALVETSVENQGARMTLEIVFVIAIFALMLRWIRANRGRIELSERPKPGNQRSKPPSATGTFRQLARAPSRVHGAGRRSVDAEPRSTNFTKKSDQQ